MFFTRQRSEKDFRPFPPSSVIPAQAGIQFPSLDRRLRGNDEPEIPACAGMTMLSDNELYRRTGKPEVDNTPGQAYSTFVTPGIGMV